ncbi:MAG: hypothetical protein J6Q65_06655, partial [Lentisphaeria bacterium]|nr:hypothetical protein [Lentisphaeria bacterium]
NTEIMNMPGSASPERVRAWHAMGHQVTNYAFPHTGVENPDYIRRVHGMELYKNDFDGTCNYHFLENGSGNIWRDTNSTFRTFSFVYATADGLIDTLEYEGFRTAIDDVRYATLLCQLVEKCMAATDHVDAMYAGKQAMLYLANVRAERDDLDTLRLEMIRHILKMLNLLEGK